LAGVQYKTKLQFRQTEVIRGGSSGALAAIVKAQELLSSGAVRFCCIGGVDSLVNGYDIQRLRAQQRLHDEDHPMGIMPSEGAGFFLVAPAGTAGQGLSRVLGAAVFEESQSLTRAPGLRGAFEAALQQAETHESKIDFLVTDHAGERSVGLDHIIARMRTFRSRRPSLPHWTFAEAAGDTSAAAGALAVVLTTTAHLKGYGQGPYAMCAASSESGSHAACVIRATASVQSSR
jgi:3-oxoacyl-(acyl-carrier-protein) synthase